MATFKANPVLVQAFVISMVSDLREDGSVRLMFEDGTIKRANAEMLARFMPGVGDYFVIQEDGYEYLNPAKVFNRKYSPVEPESMRAPVRVSHTERGIADVVIESDGSVTGTPEAVQLFRDFCKARPALLAGG